MNYTCKQVREKLDTYLDNMTNQLETNAIDKHLKECAECQSELDFLKSIIAMQAELPAIEVSDDFDSKLHQNLLVERKKQRRVGLAKFSKGSLSVLSAAAVIAISVVSFNTIKDKTENEIDYISVSTISPEYAPDAEDEVKTEDVISLSEETNMEAAPKPKENEQAKKNTTTEQKQPSFFKRLFSDTQNTEVQDNNINTENEPVLVGETENTAIAIAESVTEPAPTVEAASTTPPAAPVATVNVPEKVKVVAIVTTKDGDSALAKQMLSGYTFENGNYVLSASEYQSVLGKLDAMGASVSIAKESKTVKYAELTANLQNGVGDAASIKNELSAIDKEVSKRYIILN